MKDKNLFGDRLYDKIYRSYKGLVIKGIPSKEEWQDISKKGAKSKAEWWMGNLPPVGTSSYNAFNRLAKAYDIYTRGFYYWRRKLKASYIRVKKADKLARLGKL